MSALWRRVRHTGSGFVIASTAASIMGRFFTRPRCTRKIGDGRRRNARLCRAAFCPRCGSSVFGRTGDEIEVHLGSLDEPNQLTPTYESWIVRRESWLPPFPLTRRYEHDRDATTRFENQATQ